MVAIDTNVFVRLIMNDDASQAAQARAILTSGLVWISRTVLLEANWVLRSGYGFDGDAIRESFTLLLGHKNMQVEGQDSVSAALESTQQGVDFADALHFYSRPPGIEFVTFDRDFIRRAKRAGVKGISELSAKR